MLVIPPNLTVLVGELVGARLIAHAGSLKILAKHPARTVQILGAERTMMSMMAVVIVTMKNFPKIIFL